MATYLVTQATGQQSRTVVKHLLESGAKVHAIVRDLQKVPSVLRTPQITLFQGESKNFEDVFSAAQGCTGVFLNTVPYPGLEILQAKTVLEACKKANVQTVVSATTVTTEKKSMWDDESTKDIELWDYWASKYEVEELVRNAGFQAYTILRPAVLHSDFFLPGAYLNFPRLPGHGEIDSLLADGAKMPFTDTNDVGRYAAAALQDPEKFGGQEIDLANELLNLEVASQRLAEVSGRDVKVVKRTNKELEDMGISVFGQKFQLWANIKDLSFLTSAAEKVQEEFGIPFTSLEDTLKREKRLLLECLEAKETA